MKRNVPVLVNVCMFTKTGPISLSVVRLETPPTPSPPPPPPSEIDRVLLSSF